MEEKKNEDNFNSSFLSLKLEFQNNLLLVVEASLNAIQLRVMARKRLK